jgi:hypothetical protein
MRCKETVRKGSRCIVPVNADGSHTDGNPTHYNGNSHYKDGQFLRG